MYEYKCRTIRVIDGNTIDAEVDLGFNVLIRQRIKLFGVNPTCDISDQRCKTRLAELVDNDFYCRTVLNKRGKAGRALGYVYTIDINDKRIDVNKILVDEGFATSFGE